MRLKEKGMPLLKSPKQRRDHYVTIVVNIPSGLNSEQKEALENYKRAMNS